LFCSRAIRIKHTENINLKHTTQIIFGQIEKRFNLCDARICDHDIEGPEVFDRGFDQAFDFGEFGDVGGVAVGLATEGLDLFDGLRGVCVRFRFKVQEGEEGRGGGGLEEPDLVDACLVGGNIVDANVESIFCQPDRD
jgi:hypothetical protein